MIKMTIYCNYLKMLILNFFLLSSHTETIDLFFINDFNVAIPEIPNPKTKTFLFLNFCKETIISILK